MSVTRIYVPLTPSMVRALAETREIAPPPIPAHAVTRRLERASPSADEEEREYAALSEAAEAAGALSAGSVVRRVVVAADVDSTWVDSRRGEGSAVLSTVDITEPVPLRLVASFHVDELPGQDDDELLWYDVTELPEVVRLAGA